MPIPNMPRKKWKIYHHILPIVFGEEQNKKNQNENQKERPAYEKILIMNRGLTDGEDVKRLFEEFGKLIKEY